MGADVTRVWWSNLSSNLLPCILNDSGPKPRPHCSQAACGVNASHFQSLQTRLTLQHSPQVPVALTYREVPLGRQSLGEVVEGVGLGAHWVAVTVNLVEEVRGLVQPVVADVDVLLLHALGPTC